MPLEISQLSRRDGNKWLFRDIDLQVAEGSVLGVFGPSGSGKTSLLRAIAGHDKASSGARTLNGTEIPASSGQIRLVSGDATPSTLRSLLAGRPRHSSGERRAQAFDASIKDAGSVIVLDEPFGFLDRSSRSRCLDAIRQAAAAGRAVIFASSDFEQIAAVADTVAVILGGEIVQTGSSQDVYESPESVRVAELTGDNNLISARRLSSSDAGLPEFQTIDGGHRLFTQHVKKSRLGAINQNVTLAIRPEQVSMSMGASFPEDNLIKAIVTNITFLGSTNLIEFDAGGLTLKTRVFQIVGLATGDECMLGLPPQRIVVLPH